MTDEQIERLAEKYERSENQTGYYERIKEDYIAGARAVRDEMQCNFCKNTGKHLCPDVVQPIEINCSKKGCVYGELEKAREENEMLMNVEYWPDRCKIAEEKVTELQHKLDTIIAGTPKPRKGDWE